MVRSTSASMMFFPLTVAATILSRPSGPPLLAQALKISAVSAATIMGINRLTFLCTLNSYSFKQDCAAYNFRPSHFRIFQLRGHAVPCCKRALIRTTGVSPSQTAACPRVPAYSRLSVISPDALAQLDDL